MVLMNLMPKQERKGYSIALLVVLNLGCLFLGFSHFSKRQVALTNTPSVVPMGVEQREIVLSSLDRLERLQPALTPQAEAFKVKLNDAQSDCLVSNSEKIGISEGAEQIVFSRQFFDADPVAQQLALSQTLHPENSLALRPKASE